MRKLAKMFAVISVLLLMLLSAIWAESQAKGDVPTLVNFSGVLSDDAGKPLTSVVGITFFLYKDPQGGSPLWIETQNVQPDKYGHYTVTLGSTKPEGLPTALFASGEARWLGVKAEGQEEQPRVMLLAVPYALKAGDAQTVGGLPPSAFVLAPAGGAQSSSSAAGGQSNGTNIGGSGTAGYLAAWTDNNGDLGNSILFQKGTGSTAKLGINEASPLFTLDVNGTSLMRGLTEMATMNYATKTKGYNSNPFNLESSAFNSTTNKYTLNHFQWQAEPVGNNTTNPSATLNLLYGTDPASPTETGLNISPNGQITFAAGQTFPGAGTITGITTGSGSGLTGGGTSGTLNLGLLNTCAANQVLQWSGIAWACATISGSGTITGVTAGADLTGGGTSGVVTLNLDTTKVPQLSVGNTFTSLQTITVNNGSEGLNVTQQATSGQVYGILGTTLSTGNRSAGILGQDLASSGIAFGVEGYIADSDGAGVFGANGNPLSQTGGSLSGTFGSGVWGDGSGAGLGVIATTDNNSALEAVNNSGASSTVFAENRSTIDTHFVTAITGISFGGTGMGVLGEGPSDSNTLAYERIHDGIPRGVGGDSAEGVGVAGFSDIGIAVKGFSEYSATGVSGVSQTGSGVIGASITAAGVSGISTSGVGVSGISTSMGVAGTSSGEQSAGVYGLTSNINGPGYGVWGNDQTTTGQNSAVLATTLTGYGVLGISGTGEAVYGLSTGNTGTAGYFSATNGAFPFSAGGPGGFCTIDGNGEFSCTGNNSAMVSLPDNRSVALYAVQSPESWFEDFGSGQLVDGAAEIALDSTFAQTVNAGDYRVFPVPNGDCRGLYVAGKTATGFVVRELGGGKSNIAFDYRIVARRKGYEQIRFHDVSDIRARQVAMAERAPQLPRQPELLVPKDTAGLGQVVPASPRTVVPVLHSTGPAPLSAPRKR